MSLNPYYYSKAHAALSCKLYRPSDFDPKCYTLRIDEDSFDIFAYSNTSRYGVNPLELKRERNSSLRAVVKEFIAKLFIAGTSRVRERLPLIPSCFKYNNNVKAICWYVPYTHTAILEVQQANPKVDLHFELPMGEHCVYVASMYYGNTLVLKPEAIVSHLSDIYEALKLSPVYGYNEDDMDTWYLAFPEDSAVASLLLTSFMDGVELPHTSYSLMNKRGIAPFRYIDSHAVIVNLQFLDDVGKILKLDDIV